MVELRRAREASVSEAELQRVKQQMRGRVIMGQETNGSVADRIGSELLLTHDVRSIDQILDEIDQVTTEDLHAAAQRYLDPSSMRLALIGPHDNSARLAEILTNNH